MSFKNAGRTTKFPRCTYPRQITRMIVAVPTLTMTTLEHDDVVLDRRYGVCISVNRTSVDTYCELPSVGLTKATKA